MADNQNRNNARNNFETTLACLQPRVPAQLDANGRPFFYMSSLWHFYERPYGFPIELTEKSTQSRFMFYLAPVLFALELYEEGQEQPTLRIDPANREDILPLTDRLQILLQRDNSVRRCLLGRSDQFDSRSFVAVLWVPVIDDPFRRLVSIDGFFLSFHGLTPQTPSEGQLQGAHIMASYEERWPTIVPIEVPNESPSSQQKELVSELVATTGVPPFHTAALHTQLENMHKECMDQQELEIMKRLQKAALQQHPPLDQPAPWKCDSLAPTLSTELVRAYQRALPQLDLSGTGACLDVPEPLCNIKMPTTTPDMVTVPVPLMALLFDGLDCEFWFGHGGQANEELQSQWAPLQERLLDNADTFRFLLASSDFTRLAQQLAPEKLQNIRQRRAAINM